MEFPHHFRNPSLADLALTHRSAGRPNNERLEFLGDALLGATVAELLYDAHPNASEGELSRLRSQLVNGQALAVVARELELGDRLKLGPGELKSGGFRRESILADAFEALIAAVYLDDGYDACQQVVRRLFTPRIAELKRSSKDAKTRLQEWLQGKGLPLPVYELIDSYGEDHAKTFDVSCSIDEPTAIRVEGRAGSRRAAEQEAADAVLRRLQETPKS
ncbi:ribonuclease III [Luteibacter anthropi]|uniref:Ribonuclease 3 n=1 Tax=Luteibacter anthropi TaxID=564369 RepID=A0A7X5UAY0_9GAMM|nr:ribonuclease III [Luteibacter anthropi]NII07139.1 ribonuclease III [Luteibacter anthropi]URX62264.1 ribonuclease III [Luteibacter anthropi]